MKTGLVSVSFRNLPVEEVIAAAKAAGLDGIEWGGDVHVPAGDVEKAKYVAKLMAEADLETFSYGSYFRAGEDDIEGFQGVIDCAIALGTKIIRIWGGEKELCTFTPEYRQLVVDVTKQACDMAKPYGLQVCYECHGWTITEEIDSALRSMEEVGKENMGMYWQPRIDIDHAANMAALQKAMPYVHNFHVFYWDQEYNRYPLSDGESQWKDYIDLAKTSDRFTAAMLEFIKDDSLEQLKKDAAVLNKLVK